MSEERQFPYATYDLTVDAAYVYFRKEPFDHMDIVDDRRNVDYGHDGLPNGVELLSVAHGVDLLGLPYPEQIADALAAQGIRVLTTS